MKVNDCINVSSNNSNHDIDTKKCNKIVQFQHLQQNNSDNIPSGRVEDFQYLVGTKHRDDDDMLVYKIVRVYKHNSTGFIVGDRVLVLKDGQVSNSAQYDLEILTSRYKQRFSNDLRCNLNYLVTGNLMMKIILDL